MKKVLSMTMLTILATTLAVSACATCGCKKAVPVAANVACPCAVKTTCPFSIKPVAAVVKPTDSPLMNVKPVPVTPEVKKAEPKAKKSFAKKLKFWAK